ncbi:hypothetical protein LTR78_009170 [Recurvomyces mirabilis]|uniref:F-box domain-containing protein n=1 Tax=Recurvomyces mirabilis TaxID=574656 RepID=A0AAE0TNX8_9PEZI|nr:hypothetical protein LTR78_009170 [Recurvomyces mirabilis]KAK5155670.1 hypothetical protein LTS14_005931 [Recurvomyces mirabilis]
MAKRSRDEDAVREEERSPKRARPSTVDRLSELSDELILRVLSYLPVSQLTVCERLSCKYRGLASDNQLWKQNYHSRFVRPRANKIPGSADGIVGNGTVSSSGMRSWAGEEHLVKHGVWTAWKKQYKLRQNWTKGQAAVREIPVSEQVSIPPVLVQMQAGIIYMADTDGLRAWSTKAEKKIVAQISFDRTSQASPPTALSVDSKYNENRPRILVSFEDGSFAVYDLDQDQASFRHLYTHPSSSNGVISATALAWPYAVTMTATQSLSLYHFKQKINRGDSTVVVEPPRLLHSLRSRTVWPPLSTSLRVSPSAITISVAYALPTYLSGWTVGLQEVRVSPSGNFLSSRVASAIEQHYRPLAFAAPPLVQHLAAPVIGSLAASTATELRHIHSKPTSLSYTHPYLLVSHPDNTLALYLVTSTDDALSISAGSRLWGHTSSVSGAHVGNRGKAISVSKRGDELRVWELEGGFGSTAAKKRLATGELSVQISSNRKQQSSTGACQASVDIVHQAMQARRSSSCATESRLEDVSELTLTRGWVGFDEENVVLLKEQSHGKQALVVYDFT